MKVTSVKSFLSFVPGDLASCSETARNSCDGGHFHFCFICLTNPVKEKSGRLILIHVNIDLDSIFYNWYKGVRKLKIQCFNQLSLNPFIVIVIVYCCLVLEHFLKSKISKTVKVVIKFYLNLSLIAQFNYEQDITS